MTVGLVCPRCDALADLEAVQCPSCHGPFAAAAFGAAPATGNGVGGAHRVEERMKACTSCGNQIPGDDRFCGKCGTKVDGEERPTGTGGKTMFFAPIQLPGRAKLVLVKGDSGDGIAYQLNGTEHVLGRVEGAILFADDPLVSPRHCNFLYRDDKLFVRDEGSVNGAFLRIRQTSRIESGSVFLVGEQLLQIEASAPDFGPQPDAEGTYFYASPKRASKMRLIQRLRGGDIGIIFRARGESISIGREGNDVNFPDDPFISGHHAEVSIAPDGRFTLTDLGSKNGTYVRIGDESPLGHGDYLFVGQQLLRVEIG